MMFKPGDIVKYVKHPLNGSWGRVIGQRDTVTEVLGSHVKTDHDLYSFTPAFCFELVSEATFKWACVAILTHGDVACRVVLAGDKASATKQFYDLLYIANWGMPKITHVSISEMEEWK